MKYFSILLFVFSLVGCTQSKWETIEGIGIDEEPKSISQAIYFQNIDRGVVGGYELVEDQNSTNINTLETSPLLYLTNNEGRKWDRIAFDSKLRGSVNNVFLNEDTLICQIDSVLLFSINGGVSFKPIEDKNKCKSIKSKYFGINRYDIKRYEFEFDNINYRIKELYKNKLATLIVCWGPESLTDYYFISNDKGKTWQFLQNEIGNNNQRFLLEDKYLLTYDWPFGLKRLKLKK